MTWDKPYVTFAKNSLNTFNEDFKEVQLNSLIVIINFVVNYIKYMMSVGLDNAVDRDLCFKDYMI